MNNSERDAPTLHENERYRVVQVDFPEPLTLHGAVYYSGYGVVNKTTDVEEVYTPQLPDAIAACEGLDVAMQEEPWLWARLRTDAAKLENADTEVH